MKNNLSAIRELEKVRESICKPEFDHENVVKNIKKILKDFGYTKRPYVTKLTGLFRATSNESQDWFSEIDRFGYPEDKYVTSYGRCNRPGKPMFYCSNYNACAILEIRPALNSFVAISTWCNKKGKEEKIHFTSIAVGVQTMIENLDDSDPLVKALVHDDIFREDTPQVLKDIDYYIGKLFVEYGSDELYKFTSAITEALLSMAPLQNNQGVDCLTYPSSASNFKNVNFAFKTAYVDSNLILCKVVLFKKVGEKTLKPSYWLEKPKSKTAKLEWTSLANIEMLLDYSPELPPTQHDE